jgi:hypothetical protein
MSQISGFFFLTFPIGCFRRGITPPGNDVGSIIT